MHRRLATIAVGALSIPALGLAAYGAAHAVSDTPAPQVVIPASFHSSNGADDRTGHDPTTVAGNDEPVGHDANDDHGVDPTTSTSTPRSVPVTTQTTIHEANDGPGHDAGDDHGNDATTSTTRATTSTTKEDNRGPSQNSGPSSSSGRGSSSGSGRSGSGGGDDGSGRR